MNLFKQHQTTSGYNTIPDAIADADTAAVPLGTTVLSSSTTMTMDRCSSTGKRIAIVASTILLVVAGSTFLMMQDESLLYTTLLVGRSRYADFPCVVYDGDHCVPATGTFCGVSTTVSWGQDLPFMTCWQFENDPLFCWTWSYDNEGLEYQCIPNGPVIPGLGTAWHAIEASYANPVTDPNPCGLPCQKMHEYNPQ